MTKNNYEEVLKILQTNENCRKNEMDLVLQVYSDYLGTDAGKVEFKTILDLILKGQKNGGLPAITTVCRLSRLARHNFPELNDRNTQIGRKKKEEQVKIFVRENTIR